jgi:hypothetical protein
VQANPQTMFVDPSLITAKAPPDGHSDKNHASSSRAFAAMKIIRAPERLALSNRMGNGNGTGWQRWRRQKMRSG